MNAANSLLTSTAIARECLRVLHAKLNFVGSITRDYDDSFARQGVKAGDTLTALMPNPYVVRSGFGAPPADGSGIVQVKAQTQKGADITFTGADLTLNIDEFSDRFLQEPMDVLAGQIEADAKRLYRRVYNQVNNLTEPATFTKVLQARKVLVDNLAPLNGRSCSLNVPDNVDLIDSLKGLFNDTATVGRQYREGFMGRTAGFDFMESKWAPHDVGRGAGDIFTAPGVNRVHPETKQSTGVLQQFTLLDSGEVFPAPVLSGPGQNVTAPLPAPDQWQWVGDVGQQHGISMAYQKSAFVFASADMVMPRGVDFAAREVFDGISLRLVRQYDINGDKFPCRADVLFGVDAPRPHLACRLANH